LTHFPIIRILDQALYEYNVFIQLTAGVLLSNLLAYAISRIMEVKYKAFSKFLSLKFPSIFEV
ncbi:MAG: hypothetical protein K2Q22_08900, partial [Cytophagales bacterium]|nr:hypothetical protein [Cytophagales bacterium]